MTQIENIEKILLDVGVPAHLSGFYYLETAVQKVNENRELLKACTKKLYPIIASQHNTTPALVEKGIRDAVECAWNTADPKILHDIFGNSISGSYRPKNSQFIATIALWAKNRKEDASNDRTT